MFTRQNLCVLKYNLLIWEAFIFGLLENHIYVEFDNSFYRFFKGNFKCRLQSFVNKSVYFNKGFFASYS